MSTAEWAGLALTASINLGIGLYVYGRLTERVKGHSDTIKEHTDTLRDHETRISHLEGPQKVYNRSII